MTRILWQSLLIFVAIGSSVIAGHPQDAVESTDAGEAPDLARALSPVPAMAPDVSRKAISLRSDFAIQIVAAEPLVRDPVAIDFDSAGRLYVVQLPAYNAYAADESQAGGSVVLLEDTDHDGACDNRTVFATDLKYPSAIACWNGGVFVGDAPDLLYLKDTNGDGMADLREVVLTGFGKDKAGEAHLNSIRWGLDNRFHVSTSLSGGAVTSPNANRGQPSEPISVRNRGIVFDPRDWSRFEATSGGGQHGLSRE